MEILDGTFWTMRLESLVADPTVTCFSSAGRIRDRMLKEESGEEDGPVGRDPGSLAFGSLQEEDWEGRIGN